MPREGCRSSCSGTHDTSDWRSYLLLVHVTCVFMCMYVCMYVRMYAYCV